VDLATPHQARTVIEAQQVRGIAHGRIFSLGHFPAANPLLSFRSPRSIFLKRSLITPRFVNTLQQNRGTWLTPGRPRTNLGRRRWEIRQAAIATEDLAGDAGQLQVGNRPGIAPGDLLTAVRTDVLFQLNQGIQLILCRQNPDRTGSKGKKDKPDKSVIYDASSWWLSRWW
jgi:hypothetical protein